MRKRDLAERIERVDDTIHALGARLEDLEQGDLASVRMRCESAMREILQKANNAAEHIPASQLKLESITRQLRDLAVDVAELKRPRETHDDHPRVRFSLVEVRAMLVHVYMLNKLYDSDTKAALVADAEAVATRLISDSLMRRVK